MFKEIQNRIFKISQGKSYYYRKESIGDHQKKLLVFLLMLQSVIKKKRKHNNRQGGGTCFDVFVIEIKLQNDRPHISGNRYSHYNANYRFSLYNNA